MIIKKFSIKLVRLKLKIKRKTEFPYRNNIVSPLQMQNSYPKTPLDAYFKDIAWNGCRGGFTTQSYI